MLRSDEIEIVETIYNLTSDGETWIRRLCERVASNLGADVGVGALRACSQGRMHNRIIAQPLFAQLPKAIATVWLEAMNAAYTSTDSTMRKHIFITPIAGLAESVPDNNPYRRVYMPYLVGSGAKDSIAF